MNQKHLAGKGTPGRYARIRRRWCLAAALLVLMSTAGCAVVAGGTARPAPSLAPRSLNGQTIKQVLLGDWALSRILKQSLILDPQFPPQFGGPDELHDDGPAFPVDCLGVAAMLQQSVYQSATVKDVAVETWRQAAKSAEITGVTEAVVSLPTAADADALFAEFSQQWRKCDGTTLSMPGSVFRLKGKITNVQVATSLLAATVSIGWSSPGSDSASIPAGRAIGVRGNCLIEVEVDFFRPSIPSHQTPGDINDSAIGVAGAMMDNVATLM
jgi:hypothetical protein